jgi:hypothetical protein
MTETGVVSTRVLPRVAPHVQKLCCMRIESDCEHHRANSLEAITISQRRYDIRCGMHFPDHDIA